MNKNTNILIIVTICFFVILFVLFLTNFFRNRNNVNVKRFGDFKFKYPFNGQKGCRCLRQPNGGEKGFCGFCDRDGTAFGCPQGKFGCDIDCSKIRYKGAPCDSCRDPNC